MVWPSEAELLFDLQSKKTHYKRCRTRTYESNRRVTIAVTISQPPRDEGLHKRPMSPRRGREACQPISLGGVIPRFRGCRKRSNHPAGGHPPKDEDAWLEVDLRLREDDGLLVFPIILPH